MTVWTRGAADQAVARDCILIAPAFESSQESIGNDLSRAHVFKHVIDRAGAEQRTRNDVIFLRRVGLYLAGSRFQRLTITTRSRTVRRLSARIHAA